MAAVCGCSRSARRPAAVRSAIGSPPCCAREAKAGLVDGRGYEGFQLRAEKVKDDFVSFLIDARRQGKRVAAYGAAAKGNTLLNFAGVRRDLISYVVDRNPAKQGNFLPGSRIPIVERGRPVSRSARLRGHPALESEIGSDASTKECRRFRSAICNRGTWA